MTTVDERLAASRSNEAADDLGFGAVVARESRKRLLNRDGTFNVKREGLPFWQSLSLYHYFLTIPWPKFLAYVVGAFLTLNALFATIYVLCGAHALTGFETETEPFRFVHAFFFSVHTLATIGYGSIAPANIAANVVVTIEALVGLLTFAIVAGIMFARFARPVAQIAFSRNALIAPYKDTTAFMFRLGNQRTNEIVELRAKVMLSRRKRDGAHALDREFIPLKLERDRVVFFPLTWTVVHPIDSESPFWGKTHTELQAGDAEVLILINGFDETFSQNVHTRTSYKADEIVWGAKFKSVFNPPKDDGTMSVDIGRLDDFDRVPLTSIA
jgi:inward rectifier potassium channel